MNFDRFRISTRLLLGFALVLSLACLGAVLAAWRLGSVASEAREMMADPLAKERLAQEWFRNISAGVKRTTALAKSSDTTLDAVFAEEIKTTTAHTNAVVDKLRNSADAEERAMLDRSAELRKAFLAARQQVLEAKAAGKGAETDKLFADFVVAANTYLASVQAFVNLQMKTIDDSGARLSQHATDARLLLAVVGLATLAVGAAVALAISRSITAPLAQAADVARAVADGDLSRPCPARSGRDELSALLSALEVMRQRLGGLVSQVSGGIGSVSVASQEIARGNTDLSRRTEQTASQLQQTAGALERLTATVTQTADSARTANQLAASASDVAQRGGAVVSQVVATMADIDASSKKIADIIGTIDGIAFQTNILALNAAVEAARAGEQGRGFAVVASEVRSLAGRSAGAAREIKALIGASVEKVESGSRLVRDAGSTMNEIVSSVSRVTDIIGEISAAASEQSSGIGQVNSAIGDLDQMTQQNAALVEQSAAAAESLKTQADHLTGVVGGFRTSGQTTPATAF